MSNTLPQRPFGLMFHHETLAEGLQYIDDRASGRIKSFKTPWSGFNNASIGGLEWGSLLTIGARPGAGKTMIISQILRESRQHNPTQDFTILDFQFEMGAKQYASREFAAQSGLDYNAVLSTQKALDEFSMKMLRQQVADAKALHDVGIVRGQISEPLCKEDMEKAIYMMYNKCGNKPMIVTIDHSWLIKRGKGDREKIDVLYNTVEMIMQLKKKLPIIFIMLTQLNRTMDEPNRKHPSHIGNYPTSSDIFGGDALMQGSDMVVVLNRPWKSDIFSYGPKKYPATSSDIFMHLIKIRNGADDKTMLFFRAEFSRGRLIEVPEPLTFQGSSNAPASGQFRTLNRGNGTLVSADFGVDED